MEKASEKAAKRTRPVTDPHVALARLAVEAYVRERQTIPPPARATPEMARRAGVFVCIKSGGDLRGCIGTFEPTQRNVAEEIIHCAINAAVYDPRFPAVTTAELPHLDYAVDILMPPVRVESSAELDAKMYGVIVRQGLRQGLLLPDLEGVDTVQEQITIACRKAGIAPSESVELYRFAVRRYE